MTIPTPNELDTCQHVDPQPALSRGEEAILETKILIVRGSSLEDVFKMAMKQRDSLEQLSESGAVRRCNLRERVRRYEGSGTAQWRRQGLAQGGGE